MSRPEVKVVRREQGERRRRPALSFERPSGPSGGSGDPKGPPRKGPSRKSGDRRGGPGPVSETRKRADELAATGIPFQMAMLVAQGKLELNEALEKLSQRSEVERLMKEHDLNRAFATQVVLGHADLPAFLAKRRFDEHRTANASRSVLDEAVTDGAPRVLALFDQRRVEAAVKEVGTYEVILGLADGTTETHHKLDLKYAYLPDDAKRVKKAMQKDKELGEAPRRPAERPQDRYTCSDRRLFNTLDRAQPVAVTLLEGEVITGRVVWFSRFELGLEVKGGAVVVIFRHALHALNDAS
ncbi:MAG: hypothetical protein H6732_00490 [Alphaproteobacteria bacterium]|nr:hypothetical protein [Alphaproteobacteria bacterium]